ncbi:MAG: hypothetical protein AAGF13_03150 [Pseudomonadota bacterium]
MKKGAIPQLDSKWWSKNKAKTMGKSGLGDELKKFEVLIAKATASGQDDKTIAKLYKGALDQLKVVKKKLPVAIDKCNKKLHAETIEALKRYPKIILAEEKRLTDLVKTYAAKAAAPQSSTPAPKQKIGKPGTIWTKNIWKELARVYSADWIQKSSGGDVTLTLNNDIIAIFKAEGDDITPYQMVDDANKLFDAVLAKVVDVAKKIDAAKGKKPPQEVDKLRQEFPRMVTQLVGTYKDKFEKIPEARWKKFKSDKADYRDYQIKAGLSITKSTLGVLASGAGIVGSGGAGLALGIVGLVRGCAGLINEINNLRLGAEKVGKDLKSDLNTLMARYRDAEGKAKKSQGAQEIGGTVLKSILDIDPPFVATIPKCEANFDLWTNKLKGLSVNARSASADIKKGLAACDKLEAQIKNAQDKKAQAIYKKLTKARSALSDCLDEVSNLMKRVGEGEEAQKPCAAILKNLKSTNPKYAEIFDRVFPSLVNLGLAGGGAGVGFADQGAKALDHVNTALGLFNDIASEGEKQLEASLG